MAGLKFLVTDEHHLVREGLKLALGELGTDVTSRDAETLDKAVSLWHSEGADLVLLEPAMAGSAGTCALDTFLAECPGARVVIVSAACDLDAVKAAISKGAVGYIPKSATRTSLLAALRFVLAGNIYIPPEALAAVASAQPPSPAAESPQAADPASRLALTARQREVLNELLQGKSNRQICEDLDLALGTVKGHMAAVFAALRVGTRTEAIAAAQKLGLRPETDEGF